MKVLLLGFLGLILGLLAGGAIGVGIGSICVEVFQVSKSATTSGPCGFIPIDFTKSLACGDNA